MEVLLEQVEALEKSLEAKEEDIRQLSLQLELKTNESQAREEELRLRITELQVNAHTLVYVVRTKQGHWPHNCVMLL